jgi:predicted hydrolase (HD superfamily)
MVPSSRAEAKALLRSLGAPDHLLRHVDLVGEAADQILAELQANSIKVNEQFIQIGVALHDVGKIEHPSEMTAPGNNHEPTGEQMLLAAGASPEIARVSMSHARWSQMPVSLEELIVALADKLWKGVRVPELESMVITECASRSKRDYWQLFVGLDSSFEQIADHGSDRLARSVS